jgi:hypothetical protein
MSYKRERAHLLRQIAGATTSLPAGCQTIRDLEIDLRVLESERLREQARRWGIELRDAIGPWETDRGNTRWWLRLDKQYAEAEKAIDDARYAYFKKWVDLISPVASVVISILAFALAALALYLQLSGKLH